MFDKKPLGKNLWYVSGIPLRTDNMQMTVDIVMRYGESIGDSLMVSFTLSGKHVTESVNTDELLDSGLFIFDEEIGMYRVTDYSQINVVYKPDENRPAFTAQLLPGSEKKIGDKQE